MIVQIDWLLQIPPSRFAHVIWHHPFGDPLQILEEFRGPDFDHPLRFCLPGRFWRTILLKLLVLGLFFMSEVNYVLDLTIPVGLIHLFKDLFDTGVADGGRFGFLVVNFCLHFGIELHQEVLFWSRTERGGDDLPVFLDIGFDFLQIPLNFLHLVRILRDIVFVEGDELGFATSFMTILITIWLILMNILKSPFVYLTFRHMDHLRLFSTGFGHTGWVWFSLGILQRLGPAWLISKGPMPALNRPRWQNLQIDLFQRVTLLAEIGVEIGSRWDEILVARRVGVMVFVMSRLLEFVAWDLGGMDLGTW